MSGGMVAVHDWTMRMAKAVELSYPIPASILTTAPLHLNRDAASRSLTATFTHTTIPTVTPTPTTMFPSTSNYTLSQQLPDTDPMLASTGMHPAWDARPTQPIAGQQQGFWAAKPCPIDVPSFAAGPSCTSNTIPSYQIPPTSLTEYEGPSATAYNLSPPLPPPSPPKQQCGLCGALYDPAANDANTCITPHTSDPVLAYICGRKAAYPVWFYPCCDRYKLALGPQRVTGCFMGPHVPPVSPAALLSLSPARGAAAPVC